jgi:hypothetical protein
VDSPNAKHQQTVVVEKAFFFCLINAIKLCFLSRHLLPNPEKVLNFLALLMDWLSGFGFGGNANRTLP